MKHIAPSTIWLLMLVVGSPDSFSEVSTNALVYQVKLPKQVFVLGEPINVTFVWSNRTSEILHVERWRGPLAGVSHYGDHSIQDFAVFAEGEKRLKYKGMFADGAPWYLAIGPNMGVSNIYDITFGYEINEVGLYVLRSAYWSGKHPHFESTWGRLTNVWEGLIKHPDVQFSVRRLKDAELGAFRTSAGNGEVAAMRIVGAHKDTAAVPHLVKSLNADDRNKQTAAEALAKIATLDAVNALGKVALDSSDWMIRIGIVRLLGETESKSAIPWLKELLKDNYLEEMVDYRSSRGLVVTFSGLERYPAIVRAQDPIDTKDDRSPEAILRRSFGKEAGDIRAVKRIKYYRVRHSVKVYLKKLGVEDSTPHEVEISSK